MTRLLIECVTMAGNEYVLWERDGARFPHGEMRAGEALGEAARRIVKEWSGTSAPKLELVDVLTAPDAVTFVMRAMLVEEPQNVARRAKRMELPEKVGTLTGKYVEDALKTSLNYKLTRA